MREIVQGLERSYKHPVVLSDIRTHLSRTLHISVFNQTNVLLDNYPGRFRLFDPGFALIVEPPIFTSIKPGRVHTWSVPSFMNSPDVTQYANGHPRVIPKDGYSFGKIVFKVSHLKPPFTLRVLN
jgi:hypothetical protein